MTDLSTALPELILPPGATITVELDDPDAVVTQLNVYGYSPEKTPPVNLLPPLLTHEPLNTIGGPH